MGLRARAATPADAAAMARIYNQGIAERTATFEVRLRSAADLAGWFDGVHPICVVEDQAAAGGPPEVVAFAASSAFRARDCYRGIAELAVYVERARRGRGAGRLALQALCAAAEAGGYWKLLAAAFAENQGSQRLLAACGFREVGRYRRQALLEGAWKDVVLLERLFAANQRAPARVLFVDRRGDGLAPMAAALFERAAAPDKAVAVAAGEHPSGVLLPEVVAAMGEAGVDVSCAVPRPLGPQLSLGASLVVDLGSGLQAGAAPGVRIVAWPSEDPRGRPAGEVRALRDGLRHPVEALLAAEGWGR